MSYIGTTEIGKMYFGTTEIGKAYLGNTLVFQEDSTPPVPVPVFYDNLIFDGTAYIDTTYVMPSDCSARVRLGSETSRVQQRVFLAGNSTDGYWGMIYGGSTNNTRRQLLPYYDSGNYLTNKNINFSTYPTFNYFMTPNRFGYANSSLATYTKGNIHPNHGLVFGSNTNHSGQPYTGIMGTFYVYGSDAQNVSSYSGFDSYTPVATFRPCTYLGEAGLWYVEGSTFWGNTASSGTLSVSNNT